jgi:hypothetical protein
VPRRVTRRGPSGSRPPPPCPPPEQQLCSSTRAALAPCGAPDDEGPPLPWLLEWLPGRAPCRRLARSMLRTHLQTGGQGRRTETSFEVQSGWVGGCGCGPELRPSEHGVGHPTRRETRGQVEQEPLPRPHRRRRAVGLCCACLHG